MYMVDFIENIDFNFDTTFWVLGGTLFFFWFIQIMYYIIIYNRPYRYEKKREKIFSLEVERPSVSVIIASKNEADSLAENLPFILEQNYPNFEVIVVNMGSTDETDTLLKLLSNKYDNLYHTYVPEDAERYNEKKLALTLGVKAAKNDILLFTEAYCKPVSDMWIEQFATRFDKGDDIVLGFCKLNIDKKVYRRKFVLYDNLIFSIKYMSMAILKRTFMGVNRNLAYRREIFYEEKGFSSVLSHDNGEDDLFINRIARRRKVGVVVSPESMTETNVVDKFRVWKNLKSKYLYTKKQYKGSSSFVFAVESFSKYCFYILSLGLAVYGIYYQNWAVLAVSVLLFLLRFVTQLVIINRYNKNFGSGRYGLRLIGFDMYQPINNFRFRKYEKKKNKYKR